MYDNAKRALKVFWDKAKNKLSFKSFEEMIEYYRTDFDVTDVLGNPLKHDDFLETFNKAVGYVSDWDDVRSAMQSLADNLPKGKIPSTSSYFDALSNQVERFTFNDAKTVVNKTVEQAKDVAIGVAIGGASLWAMYAVGALLLIMMANRK